MSLLLALTATSGGGDVTADGVTLTQPAVLIFGDAAGAASVSGVTLTQPVELVAGAATGASLATGAALEQSNALTAGSSTGAALVGGTTLTQPAEFLPGTATGGAGTTTADGVTFTQPNELTAGSATGAATVGGDLVGYAVSLTAGTVTIPGSYSAQLDQILAILMGRKVYDSTTRLWRVYDANSAELADPSGILLRGLHGWLLRQANQQAANDADIQPGGKRCRRVVIPPGYAPTPAVRRPRDDDDVLLMVGLV